MSWRLRVRSQKERSLNTNGDVVLRPAKEILHNGVSHVARAKEEDPVNHQGKGATWRIHQ